MKNNIYEYAFALAYQAIWEERFAVPIFLCFSKLSRHFNIQGTTFADIACGTGRFAYELGKQGYNGIGIDQSSAMIDIARQRAEKENMDLKFEVQDMRCFQLGNPVDFITCWFDSLNYLASIDEVKEVFRRCYRSLKPGGVMLLDIETRSSFQNRWGVPRSVSMALKRLGFLFSRKRFRSGIYLLKDICLSFNGRSARTFVSREAKIQAVSFFDSANDSVLTTITGTVKNGKKRLPISELHVQKVFEMESIEQCLYDVGFSSVCAFCFPDFSLPTPEEKRVYFYALKEGS